MDDPQRRRLPRRRSTYRHFTKWSRPSRLPTTRRGQWGSGVRALNNTNIPGAVLHVTLAPRVLGVTPTDEDGVYARSEIAARLIVSAICASARCPEPETRRPRGRSTGSTPQPWRKDGPTYARSVMFARSCPRSRTSGQQSSGPITSMAASSSNVAQRYGLEEQAARAFCNLVCWALGTRRLPLA